MARKETAKRSFSELYIQSHACQQTLQHTEKSRGEVMSSHLLITLMDFFLEKEKNCTKKVPKA